MAQIVATELKIRPGQALPTLELLDAGNTVPFIARYRKEATGNLDEVPIQAIADRAAALRALHARKRDVLRIISEQGKLTPALAQAILAAQTLAAVEDLYLPYRPRRKTRASVAREKGLQPLADLMLRQARLPGKPEEALAAAAQPFVHPEKGIETVAAALAGARDICAETVMEDAGVRGDVRALFFKDGALGAKLTVEPERIAEKDARGVYRLYYDFNEPVTRMVPHRILALNRAEREDVVRVSVDLPFERAEPLIHRHHRPDDRSPFAGELKNAISDGYRRLLAPALEREVRAELTRRAEEHAIHIFAANLRPLLLQPPLRGTCVLGLDPGFRTGCKVAVVDGNGKPLATTTIYPHAPQAHWDEAKSTLKALIAQHNISAIAIGNGTASRETETLAAQVIAELEKLGRPRGSLGYVMVNEAGASVYSASEVARKEFPDLDATERGTISIARRLQDPLAELVKIDAKAIGVGLYQHDVDQQALATALDRVVVSCVNFAGVDVNAASAQLLRYVSGISPRVAEHLLAYRAQHGPFTSREQLRKVSGLGPTTFVQAAGFLKISGGAEPLDNTFIHPESYAVARSALARLPDEHDQRVSDRVRTWRLLIGLNSRAKGADASLSALAKELGVGVPTLTDILENLEKPGLDPRDSLPRPILRQDILKLEDLTTGMVLEGTVRNVVDFGAFIDIGVKQDGLVHVSELAERFVRDPLSVVSVGQVVRVRVMSVDGARGRVQLSMRDAL
ncbi:MAG: RNA-binding transcriptional accessory protein [Ktedonobacterales bacterium]|nr:RNA-binding transcriptional accessory protein [Ktedonobacterales bacterium]